MSKITGNYIEGRYHKGRPIVIGPYGRELIARNGECILDWLLLSGYDRRRVPKSKFKEIGGDGNSYIYSVKLPNDKVVFKLYAQKTDAQRKWHKKSFKNFKKGKTVGWLGTSLRETGIDQFEVYDYVLNNLNFTAPLPAFASKTALCMEFIPDLTEDRYFKPYEKVDETTNEIYKSLRQNVAWFYLFLCKCFYEQTGDMKFGVFDAKCLNAMLSFKPFTADDFPLEERTWFLENFDFPKDRFDNFNYEDSCDAMRPPKDPTSDLVRFTRGPRKKLVLDFNETLFSLLQNEEEAKSTGLDYIQEPLTERYAVILPNARRLIELGKRYFHEVILWSNSVEARSVLQAFNLEHRFDKTIYLPDILKEASKDKSLHRDIHKYFSKDLSVLGNPKNIVLIQDETGNAQPEDRVVRIELWDGDPTQDELIKAFRKAYHLMYDKRFTF